MQASLCCIIPAYRAPETIVTVVTSALRYADLVVVVDDGCPEQTGRRAAASFEHDSRVEVIFRDKNGGVGAAMKTGIARAIERQADIIVKLDADGQMDPAFIPLIRGLFERDPSLAYIKGNRFFDASVLKLMPRTRLLGNAALSIMAKMASGYWNTIDPTNGYLAFNANLLRYLRWQEFSDTYFFEISVLCELGLRRLPILELEMPTIYTSAQSSLPISRVIFEFPPKIVRRILRRIVRHYFVFDVNVGTLYGVVGMMLLLFGLIFGGYEWIDGAVTHTPRATGTIVLALLPFLMGFQLLLNALMYDVQVSPNTQHELLVAAHSKLTAFATGNTVSTTHSTTDSR